MLLFLLPCNNNSCNVERKHCNVEIPVNVYYLNGICMEVNLNSGTSETGNLTDSLSKRIRFHDILAKYLNIMLRKMRIGLTRQVHSCQKW